MQTAASIKGWVPRTIAKTRIAESYRHDEAVFGQCPEGIFPVLRFRRRLHPDAGYCLQILIFQSFGVFVNGRFDCRILQFGRLNYRRTAGGAAGSGLGAGDAGGAVGTGVLVTGGAAGFIGRSRIWPRAA